MFKNKFKKIYQFERSSLNQHLHSVVHATDSCLLQPNQTHIDTKRAATCQLPVATLPPPSPMQAFQLSLGAAMEHPTSRMMREQMLARLMAVANAGRLQVGDGTAAAA